MSVFLHSPNKMFWACLGDLAPEMPLSSGQIVPRVTIAEGSTIHPTWDRIFCYSIAGCFKATRANISACTVVTHTHTALL